MSATFSDLGGIIVDGDVIAREVVEPGTEGLAKLVEAFGDGILLPEGALNRPALAAVAFSDDEKRATLNGIVHPLVAHRRSELIAAAHDDAVIVEVADTGSGIPADVLPRIFEPFYRLPGASEREGGVGLGLALVRQIARRHGGDRRDPGRCARRLCRHRRTARVDRRVEPDP